MNMKIYEATRKVPEEALKKIEAGRLKGKSDINPMWRIKTLTEQFGPCGIGWKYVITKQWLEEAVNNEISAFVNIDLYYKYEGQWSEAVPGNGGSSFVSNEKNGPYMNDECFKMALTDAISVACKALGFGANVYWDRDKTKYDISDQKKEAPPIIPDPDTLYVTELQMKDLLLLEDTKRLQDGYNSLKEFGATYTKEQNARIKARKEQLIKEGK